MKRRILEESQGYTKRKKIPFTLSCMFGQRKASIPQGFHITMIINKCDTSSTGLSPNHSPSQHLMPREDPPVCNHCQVRLSNSHILVECPNYSVSCNRFLPSMTSVPPRERLSFLLSESSTFSSSTLRIF